MASAATAINHLPMPVTHSQGPLDFDTRNRHLSLSLNNSANSNNSSSCSSSNLSFSNSNSRDFSNSSSNNSSINSSISNLDNSGSSSSSSHSRSNFVQAQWPLLSQSQSQIQGQMPPSENRHGQGHGGDDNQAQSQTQAVQWRETSNGNGPNYNVNLNFNVAERDNHLDKHYMDLLMERTNTYVQWPSRMKIGAKTKKDLFIRVYGHNENDVNEAKNQILADLGPHRDLRITLKMDISYTDHSHLIGCRGQTIRRVMEDTGCHIHFPDSNRMSKEHKSNQVTIAGSSISAVEQARSRVRQLSPLIFQFSLPMMHSPYEMQMNPDAHHIFLENVQSNYGVQVTIHPPNKLQQTSVSVKGCEKDAINVKEAVAKIISYFSPGKLLNSVIVESTMEISSAQHGFVRAVNDTNVHTIMMNTGAKIIFPDLTDGNIQQIKRSRVYISGDINCVYYARQQLIGCLPLRMIFDLSDEFQLDWDGVRQMGSDLNVNVKLINRNRATGDRGGGGAGGAGLSSLPPPIPGRSRTIQLVGAERNTSNIYEVRRRILGGLDPGFVAEVPPSYMLRPTYPCGDMKGSYQYGNRLGPPVGALPPLLLPTSPNMLSPVLSPSFWPPTPFSSPFCSPPIATCVMNGNGNANNMNSNMGMNMSQNQGQNQTQLSQEQLNHNHRQAAIGKMTLNLHPQGLQYNYNGLPSPSPLGPGPEININNMSMNMNNMKHHMHLNLPLMDHQQYQNQHGAGGDSSTLTTPMSTMSDLTPQSPMASHHPGVGMFNALINDVGNTMMDLQLHLQRKAPGCERSNTMPNLLLGVNLPDDLALAQGQGTPQQTSRSGTPGEDQSQVGAESQSQENEPSGDQDTEEREKNEKVNNPMNEKKYMAVKAMYNTKIGCAPRVPTSEWSGCGFSKTYMNLFPNDSSNSNSNNGTSGYETGTDGSKSNWTSEAEASSSASGGKANDKDKNNDQKNQNSSTATNAKNGSVKTHGPLGHQQSNLLDFAATRPNPDKPPSDLASLFIQNGLEKYIDKFITEEIDLDAFATLTEGDLRTLGVSAYPARKRMLVLITQLACPHPDQDWR